MVIAIISTVAKVKLVSILLSKAKDGTLLTIEVLSGHQSISKSLVSKLAKENDINLDTKDINTYMISLLLEYYNVDICCTCRSDSFKIDFIIA